MAGDSHNPYQAPVEEAAEKTEASNSWSVSGDYLLVRPGTLLPPVTLEGRGSLLTPAFYRFNVLAGGHKAMTASLLPALLIVGWIQGTSGIVDEGIRWTVGIVSAAVAMAIVSRFAKTINTMIWGFVPVETLRKRSRRRALSKRLLTSGLLLLGATFLAVMVTVPHHVGRRGLDIDAVFTWLLPALAISFALMIASVACGGFKLGLNCTLYRDGWLYLKGVPMESLAEFAAKSMAPIPGKRMRKVYTYYLNRKSLNPALPGKKWHLGKALRSTLSNLKPLAPVARLGFHISERVTLPLAEADPDLLARWKRESSSTRLGEWPLILATRIDSPQGEMRTEWVFYVSPDWRHFAGLNVTRVSAGHVFHESHGVHFRAWGEDGRSFFTSSAAAGSVVPDDHDWLEASGSLPEIAEAHFARLRSTPLLVLGSVEELGKRMEEDVEAFSRLAEGRGEQGAVQEMEFQDFPA
ncbi:hypothetical protein [Luteolibacter luteus]|uniref:Uncharacterized protein n=1 Tax=Luteolibacter luteus TaxID=2728835 RepID=A0A858RL03_9BACT|nr:hypothetical protein [Luteolibacter luteus]QJE97138.1 hypothetical protein HHL09_15525 [Luteolibacter luteus]